MFMIEAARKRKLENIETTSYTCSDCKNYEDKKKLWEFLIWKRSRYENSDLLKQKLYLLKLDFNEHIQTHIR